MMTGTILHITEVSSGGVLPMIANICNGTVSDFRIIVAYGVRFDTPADIGEYFDERIELIPISSFTRLPNPRKDFLASKEIRSIVRKCQPDIVHFHSTKAGLIGRLSLVFWNGKKYYTPHGYSFLKQDDARVKRVLYYAMEKILAYTGGVTVACGNGEWIYAKKLRQNALCINNGIDCSRIDSILSQKFPKAHEFTVYTAGRIGPQKNPELFNRIADRCRDIRFVWIGEGEERDKLTSPNISITGLLPWDQVIELAFYSDCYLSCSLWEGLPVALLEAMYLGKECIVSDVAGNNDLIAEGKTGYLAREEKDYVNAIHQVQTNGSKRGIYAHEKVNAQYRMERMCLEYRELYCKALSGGVILRKITFFSHPTCHFREEVAA